MPKQVYQGYVLSETKKRVVIATGFRRPSSNPKTGPMVQVWILAKDTAPHKAVKSGLDSIVCGSCKHRGGSCYVSTFQGPRAVWASWRRGNYPVWDRKTPIFVGHAVRWGAYGDPTLIPANVRAAVNKQAKLTTGYTHQWHDGAGSINARHTASLSHLMASCDTSQERAAAKEIGARTFRVMGPGESLERGEILCPASDEAGKRTTCEKCGLCGGADKLAKDIAIYVHGKGASKFETARRAAPLVQIGGVALD